MRLRTPLQIAGTAAVAAVIGGFHLSASAAEPARTADTGVVDSAIATSGSSTIYRIPDITVTTRGTVLLAYDRRNGSDRDLPNDIDTMLVRSTDVGKTWSQPQVVVDYPGPAGCGDSSMTVDRRTSRILLFCTYSAGNVGFGNSKPGTNDTTDPYTLHVQLRYSDDDGLTWSAPTDLNPQVKDPSWQAYFAASGHGLQTSSGRLIQPLVVKDSAGKIHSADIYSDDDGATWHTGQLLDANTDESKAVELSDGTILQNSRPDAGGYRFLSTSTDGGQTFSHAGTNPQLIDPHVNGDEIRVNPRTQGEHRDWLLFVNPASQIARTNLTVRLSCDNGATWPISKVLHAGPSGYPAAAMLPDGRVGVFYEGGTGSYTEALRFVSFGLDDLGAHCTD